MNRTSRFSSVMSASRGVDIFVVRCFTASLKSGRSCATYAARIVPDLKLVASDDDKGADRDSASTCSAVFRTRGVRLDLAPSKFKSLNNDSECFGSGSSAMYRLPPRSDYAREGPV